MSCIFDSRWQGIHGIGRFARELAVRLPNAPYVSVNRPMSPLDPFRLALHDFKPSQWFLSPGYNAPIISTIPYILTLHDLNHIDCRDNSSIIKRLYYHCVLRYLCNHARAVLTVSHFSKCRIVEWSGLEPSRVFSVGNGVSSVFCIDGPRFNAIGEYILCVSNRRGHKNENGLIHAFARSRLPPSVKLLLTGKHCDRLIALSGQLGVKDRLVFSGRVSEDELAALYRGAQFLAFPSFYEGFGLPIIEAFACGTPVLTSNVTSMPEIAGDAALLVNPYDIDNIARAMTSLYELSNLRKELIERGLNRVTQFSWDAVVDRVKAAVKAVDTDSKHPLNWN